jgi:hypothetical protein
MQEPGETTASCRAPRAKALDFRLGKRFLLP